MSIDSAQDCRSRTLAELQEGIVDKHALAKGSEAHIVRLIEKAAKALTERKITWGDLCKLKKQAEEVLIKLKPS